MQDIKVKWTVDNDDLRVTAQLLAELSEKDRALISDLGRVSQAARTAGDSLAKAPQSGATGLSGYTKRTEEATKATSRLRDETGKFVKTAKDGGDALGKSFDKAKGGSDALQKTINGLAGKIAGLFAIDQLIQFGQKVLDITSQFQKLEAVLSNALGSDSAGEVALATIQQFAAQTNFSVLQVTDTFVKLVNAGFKPTMEELTNLADLTNSTGKELDQLAEAIIDAQTGEFERLKEFGIQASKSGDQVTFTFKGVQTTVKNTASEIQKYIVGLGALEGVSGSTAAISATWVGRMSNLGDAFDQLFGTIGQKSSGFAASVIDAFTRIVQATNEAILSEEEYQKKLALRDQAKVNEGLPKALEDLTNQYKSLGFSAEEAAKKARLFYEQDAGNQLKKLYDDLRNIQVELDKIKNDGSLSSEIFGIEVFDNDVASRVEELEKLRAKTLGAIEVQRQYLTTLDEIQSKANKPITPTVDTKQLEKDLKEYLKLVQDLDLKKFVAQVDLNEELLGKNFPTVLGQRAVAARESIIREFDKLYEDTKKIGEKLVAAGLLDRDKLNQSLEDIATIRKTKLAEIAADTNNGYLAIDADKLFGSKADLDKALKDREDSMKKFLDRVEQSMKDYNDKFEAERKEDERREKEHQKRKQALIEESFDTLLTFADAYFQISSQNYNNDLARVQQVEETKLAIVGDNEQAQSFIREEAARKNLEIRRRQAQAEKAQGIFQVAINTAEAIAKTLSQYGMPLAIPFIALAAAQGAVQIAAISSRPLPQFRKGVIDLQGEGTETSDSIMARLSKGESVMTAKETREYKPLFMAIREKRVDPVLMNMIATGSLPTGVVTHTPEYIQVQQKLAESEEYNRRYLDEIRSLRRTLEQLPIHQVNLDKNGITTYLRKGNSVRESLNNQFPN